MKLETTHGQLGVLRQSSSLSILPRSAECPAQFNGQRPLASWRSTGIAAVGNGVAEARAVIYFTDGASAVRYDRASSANRQHTPSGVLLLVSGISGRHHLRIGCIRQARRSITDSH